MSEQNTIKLTINGQEVTAPKGVTVLQACEQVGIEIPRFCYHDRLKIAGNCRMCLVQIEGGPPKPAASCAMPAAEGMVVHTDSPMVKKAREGVMEFLLINHPLDCPICDQGGECDLQDQAMAYGRGSNRFHENKRAVKEKNMGPLIKTQMTRCIHCTRCVRFSEEIAGVEEIGAVGRGEHMEITTYLEQAVTSELSGNVIDLCPVGALTSKPYAFTARSWELRKTETIDVLDAVGCNIRVDSRGREVMRVLPRLNEEINEEWISDKTRFACDGLKAQRLDRPYVRKAGKLQPVSWDEAISTIAARWKDLEPTKIAAIAGDLADLESMWMLKQVMKEIGSPHLDCRQDGVALEGKVRAAHLFNTTIAGIEQADACLIIGTNPRLEAPLVNARLRKRSRMGAFPVGVIGPEIDLTYNINNLGNNIDIIDDIISGKSEFSKVLADAKQPMIIVGYGVLTRPDAAAIQQKLYTLCEKYGVVTKEWNGYNVLHKVASRVGGLEIGFVPASKGKDVAGILAAAKRGTIESVFLLGADEIDMKPLADAFVVYQGHHGDAGAHAADVILPGAAYTEKDATYVNLEGRAQRAVRAVFPPGEAKDDREILALLAQALGQRPATSLDAVRAEIAKAVPTIAEIDVIVPAKWEAFGKEGEMDAKSPIKETLKNFYMTDPISRASRTMAECVDSLAKATGKKGKKEAA
ncbi:MAG: NADH-quinone oxidoreductase subunit G [Hyphomicrobiales bacterium]|nr:NADH-quinone oxidoreductase subunit G [Hyphomicrobiales bacterium]